MFRSYGVIIFRRAPWLTMSLMWSLAPRSTWRWRPLVVILLHGPHHHDHHHHQPGVPGQWEQQRVRSDGDRHGGDRYHYDHHDNKDLIFIKYQVTDTRDQSEPILVNGWEDALFWCRCRVGFLWLVWWLLWWWMWPICWLLTSQVFSWPC